MAMKHHCDKCDCVVTNHPDWEYIPLKDEKGAHKKNDKGEPLYEVKKIREFNIDKGKTVEREIFNLKYSTPKAVMVRLAFGDHNMNKTFCENCFKTVEPAIEALYAQLRAFETK